MGFLIYPQNPGQQMTPEQRRQAMQQQIAQQIMGQPANTPEGGISQLAAGLAQWRGRQQQQYPDAPGGASPSMMTNLRNLFGNNGGLY
jgi:hypothetical protein